MPCLTEINFFFFGVLFIYFPWDKKARLFRVFIIMEVVVIFKLQNFSFLAFG